MRFLYDHLFQGPLLRSRTVVLVTHHIELVLPGAYYVVRMLDGRVDLQGTARELRARRVLDDIAQEGALISKEIGEDVIVETSTGDDGTGIGKVLEAEAETTTRKEPRKFVKDEERAAGSVKWAIYKTYLQAS